MTKTDRPGGINSFRLTRGARAFAAALAVSVPLLWIALSSASAQDPAKPAPAAQPQAVSPPVQTQDNTAPPAAAPAPTAATSQTVPSIIATAALPRDLSPWGMFLNADILVQVVMVGLLFASLVTWTVGLAKTIELLVAKRRAREGVRILQAARSLGEASQQFGKSDGVVSRLVRTAGAEVKLSDGASSDALKERISWLLERIEVGAGRHVGRGMGLLASIGATAPFVGLFGTVWGIMNSFIGISNAHTTNLAVVAPGIAEALLATALGLFAAIPAVVIYNVFARAIGGYRAEVADAGALVMRLVSRDTDRGSMSHARAAE